MHRALDMMRAIHVIPLVLSAALSGCAHEYAYVPVDNAVSRVSGQLAAAYPVPPEAPRGELRVASFGIVPIEVAPHATAPALHLRMAIINRGGTPWTVDTREQRCAIAGEGYSRPIFASVDEGSPPVLAIPPATQRTVDLFYPLPVGRADVSQLRGFSLSWQVDTGDGRVVALATPFERVTLASDEIAYADAGYYDRVFWGPYWWYDPVYFEFRFAHPWPIARVPVVIGPRIVGPPPPGIRVVPPPVVRARPPVIIARPPRRHR